LGFFNFIVVFLAIVDWIIFISVFAIFKETVPFATVLSSLLSLVTTVVSLMIIQFIHIYNRKDNKLLDIIKDILKISSDYEKSNKKNRNNA